QPSTDVAALIGRANQRLEAHQRIRDWSIWPQNEFPRTASTLKLRRHEIALQLHSGSSAEPAAGLPDISAMTSLERVELLSELENKYQIELNEDTFAGLKSTRELDDWLSRPETAAAPVEQDTALSDWARSLPVHW